MRVLVTGGAGYIGSHAAKRLLSDGAFVLILDDLSRGHAGAIERLRSLPHATGRLAFERCRVHDRTRVGALLREHRIDSILHFAAYAYVDESVGAPLLYHENNACGTVALLGACVDAAVTRFVLSSTCAVYGEPDRVPVDETSLVAPTTPYGASKAFAERAVFDVLESRRRAGVPFSCATLRYFNVAGCDADGLLGEHHDPQTRLIPCLLLAAMGARAEMTLFGDDYPTRDGTCERDFIHVDDLVDAHALALRALDPARHEGRTYNLGTGRSHTVLEVAKAVERVTGAVVKTRRAARRPGDAPRLCADASKIGRELGWTARRADVEEIVRSAWAWFKYHPDGYGMG